MRIPKPIRHGDVIGFTAPSFGASTEPYITRFDAALKAFSARGYRLKEMPSCRKGDGLGISTNPKDAARDLMDIYLDPEVSAVISVGGGELMDETISFIDFDRLKEAPPKWYMGYSDNTNFLYPMATRAGVAGIYGPCATGFGKPWEKPEEDAFGILEGTVKTISGYELFELPWDGDSVRKADPLAKYVLSETKVLRTMVPSEAGLREADAGEQVEFKGKILGGCLDILINLSGTKYGSPFIAGEEDAEVIWLIEACDLSPMSIRRSLWSLRNQGWFEHASGFIIGRPLAAFREDMMGVNQYNAVTDMLGDFGVPIIMDADVGHVSPMMPLVIGADAAVTCRGNEITIRMEI